MKEKTKKIKKEVKTVVNRLSSSSVENKEYAFFQKSAVCLMLELYPDDLNYNFNEVLNHLVKYADDKNCMYAYIYHDKDKFDKSTYDNDHKLIGRKGDLKKPHVHFILCSNLNVPFIISDVFLGVKFPSRFIKIIKPKDIDNVCLYLSHIKYSNKYRYDVSLIQTNRQDYIYNLHQDYKPSSAISFVSHYLNLHCEYISFNKMWDLALNQNDIPFDDYLRCYNIIKDMINEHNLVAREDNIKSAINSKVEMQATIKADKENQKIYNLATTFGSTQIEINGKKFTVSYHGD